ncbi:MAG: SH3 domain-containing protein [Bacteroidia bacterium]
MKKFIFLILFFPVFLIGQTPSNLGFSTVEVYSSKYEAPYHYLLADDVNLRKCPERTCTSIDALKIGQRMILLEKSQNAETINGITSHWYKVEADDVTGWIWGGMIAQGAFGSKTDPSVKFVYGLKKADPADPWYPVYQIRAFKDHKEIARKDIEVPTRGFQIQGMGNNGLNLNDIISISLPCNGGCGCTTGNLVIFWNGQEFSEIEELLGTADAWASEATYFIYPTSMEGIPNILIKVSEFFIDEQEDGKIKRGITREYFKWNGKKLVPDSSRKTEKITYVMEI